MEDNGIEDREQNKRSVSPSKVRKELQKIIDDLGADASGEENSVLEVHMKEVKIRSNKVSSQSDRPPTSASGKRTCDESERTDVGIPSIPECEVNERIKIPHRVKSVIVRDHLNRRKVYVRGRSRFEFFRCPTQRLACYNNPRAKINRYHYNHYGIQKCPTTSKQHEVGVTKTKWENKKSCSWNQNMPKREEYESKQCLKINSSRECVPAPLTRQVPQPSHPPQSLACERTRNSLNRCDAGSLREDPQQSNMWHKYLTKSQNLRKSCRQYPQSDMTIRETGRQNCHTSPPPNPTYAVGVTGKPLVHHKNMYKSKYWKNGEPLHCYCCDAPRLTGGETLCQLRNHLPCLESHPQHRNDNQPQFICHPSCSFPESNRSKKRHHCMKSKRRSYAKLSHVQWKKHPDLCYCHETPTTNSTPNEEVQQGLNTFNQEIQAPTQRNQESFTQQETLCGIQFNKSNLQAAPPQEEYDQRTRDNLTKESLKSNYVIGQTPCSVINENSIINGFQKSFVGTEFQKIPEMSNFIINHTDLTKYSLKNEAPKQVEDSNEISRKCCLPPGYLDVKSSPERVDIYLFDHQDSRYFQTTDNPPPVRTEMVVHEAEDKTTRWFAEIFGSLHLVCAILIAFALQLFKFLLVSLARPLLTAPVQIFSDYIFKPVLTIIFNGLLQPPIIFLYNVATSIRDLACPIAKAIGYFLREFAAFVRAFRVIDVRSKTTNGPFLAKNPA